MINNQNFSAKSSVFVSNKAKRSKNKNMATKMIKTSQSDNLHMSSESSSSDSENMEYLEEINNGNN